MVKRLFSFLNREIGGLHQAAYLLGFFAFLSQILALIRDRLLAYVFGASHSLDVYYAAFRLPDFIFAAVASVVSLSVLIPFLVEKLDRDMEEGRRFIDSVFSLFVWFILVVGTVLYFSAPWLVHFFFPTLAASADGPILLAMTRILLLSPLFLGLSNFFASVTQVYKRFLIYAVSPLLYNAGIIFGIVVLYPRLGLRGLAYGVVLGAFLHMALQIPFVAEKGLFPRFRLRIDWRAIRRVTLLSVPRTITSSTNEIAEFILVSLASVMAGGSISVFNFAWNLQSVPLSIVGVSYSLAAFPALARHHAKGERSEFVAQMVGSARHIIFWSTPIMVLFIVLRAQIVRIVLGSGHFDWSDTRLTAAALSFFVLSLVPQGLMLLFVRSYYARGKTFRPLVINVCCAALSVGLAYALSSYFLSSPVLRLFVERLMRVEGVSGTEVLMLPLAFALGMILNAALHWIDFSFSYPEFNRPVARVLFQSIGAAVLAGEAAYVGLIFWGNHFDLRTLQGVFLQGFCAGIGGIIVGVAILRVLGSEELSEVLRTLHRKIWKAKPSVSDQVPM